MIYVPEKGEMLVEVAQNIVMLAQQRNEEVIAEFNSIPIRARPQKPKKEEILEILYRYQMDLDRKRRKYFSFSSEEVSVSRLEKAKKEKEYEIDSLMIELAIVDFYNLSSVISWLGRLQELSSFVPVPAGKIIQVFEKKGYFPNDSCGESLKPNDEEAFARFIIGQALGDLEYCGKIHSIFRSFERDWKQKYDYA